MVPALAEAHRAHMERRQRLGVAVSSNVVPLSRIQPPPKIIARALPKTVSEAEKRRRVERAARRDERTREKLEHIRLSRCEPDWSIHPRAVIIVGQVASKHAIPTGMILNHYGKGHRDFLPYQEACYRLRRELKLPLLKIARVLGRSHHTTSLHAIQEYQRKAKAPPVVKGVSTIGRRVAI